MVSLTEFDNAMRVAELFKFKGHVVSLDGAIAYCTACALIRDYMAQVHISAPANSASPTEPVPTVAASRHPGFGISESWAKDKVPCEPTEACAAPEPAPYCPSPGHVVHIGRDWKWVIHTVDDRHVTATRVDGDVIYSTRCPISDVEQC